MDTRTALKSGTMLDLGGRKYKIEKERARGGSGIVYSAYYLDNAGCVNPVLIKECYPFKCRITRNENMSLTVPEFEKKLFDDVMEKLLKAYILGNKLFLTKDLTNSTANTYDIYRANNTLYIVSAYIQGKELCYSRYDSVKDCISIVKSAAKTILRIHNEGYLYLDLKPENIFTIDETTDIVELFDFDSLMPIDIASRNNADNITISFTKGYAALELQRCDIRKIGRHTDVYSIGAVLFYLLFDRVPNAVDCSIDAEYDYESSKLGGFAFRDRLYSSLTEFFHKTLASYYPDRYPAVDIVAASLDELERLADTLSSYIIGTRLINPKHFVGRTYEITALTEFLRDDEEHCLFITGMGGIGKSTLARKVIYDNRKLFDNILYINYSESIEAVIANDNIVHINTVSKDENESVKEYFERKILALNKIARNEKTLFVIDNFETDDNIRKLLETNIKLVIISRNETCSGENNILRISELKESEELYSLFEDHLGRKITESEINAVDEIIRSIRGHTLVLELIAKQISSPVSCLSIEGALRLAKEKGFSHIADEKVEYYKDLGHYRKNISDIIEGLFCFAKLSTDKRVLVRVISVFGDNGIAVSDLCDMLDINNRDSIIELYSGGWIAIEKHICIVHPVIRETVCGSAPDNDIIGAFGKIIGHLANNFNSIKNNIFLSEPIISECRKYNVLTDSVEYKNLLFDTLENMPRDREEFIRSNTEYLLDEFDIEDENMLMKLYENLTEIYYEHSEIDLAYKRITEAGKRIKGSGNAKLKGQYFYLLAGYYDSVLNGRYFSRTAEDEKILSKMLSALNKAIFFESISAKNKSGPVLAERLRCKALVLIRSGKGKQEEIRKILDKIQKLLEKNAQPDPRSVRDYKMTLAWYYTYNEPDYGKVTQNIKEAYDITLIISPHTLDRIDEVIYPSANILLEWERFDEAAEVLQNAIQLCEDHKDIKVYYNKKLELLRYLLDVHFYSADYDKCRKLIKLLDKEAEECSDINISEYVSEEIRRKVYKA